MHIKSLTFITLALAAPASALTVMPMGDSITKGFHGTPSGSYRYELAQMRTSVDFAGEFTTSAGLSFDSHHQGTAGHRIEEMTADYGPAVALHQPDVVLLLAGTNNHFDGPDADYATLYGDLLDMIRSNAPAARVVMATVPRFGYERLPDTSYWTTEWVDQRNERTFPAMNAAMAAIADADPLVSVVDFYQALDSATDLHTDAVHPTLLGQAKLADLFDAALSRLLADVDADGDVDDSDLGAIFSSYTGPTGNVGATIGDTDGDGDVDDSDLGTAFSNYTGPLAASVPEPASLALMGLGGFIIARRRRA